MATSVQKMLVEKNLSYLEELAQILHLAVDEKVKKVVADGKSWLTQDVDVETRQSYKDVKQVTESAITFVSEIFQQIEDDWEKNDTQELSAETETKRFKKSAEVNDIKSLKAYVNRMEERVTSLTARQDLTESKFSHLEGNVRTKLQNVDGTLEDMTTIMQSEVLKHKEKVEDIKKKLHNLQETQQTVSDAVQSSRSGMTAPRKKSDSPHVTFTASVQAGYRPVKGMTVTGYEKVKGNKDLSFSADTGIFTAPVKGMYSVSVRQWQWDNGAIGMNIKKTRQSQGSTAAVTLEGKSEEWICWTGTRGHDEREFCLAVTEMEVGDTLSVVPMSVTQNPSLSSSSTFSVFLVNS